MSTTIISICIAQFLSTLSLRRATPSSSKTGRRFRYFYPRSPCGERPGAEIQHPGKILISIHALLAESDAGPDRQGAGPCSDFYPRSPCGERPALKTIKALFDTISIHALLAESDTITAGAGTMISPFLSTLSLRRATR